MGKVVSVRNLLVHYKSASVDFGGLDKQLARRETKFALPLERIELALTRPFEILEEMHVASGVEWYYLNLSMKAHPGARVLFRDGLFRE